MKNGNIRIAILTFALAILTSSLYAQSGPPGSGGNAAPIDGGVVMLAAAGAAYGYRKMKKQKLENRNQI